MSQSTTELIDPFQLHPESRVGVVALAVADLGRMVAYYQEVIGLSLLAQEPQSATLGVDGQPIVRLHHRPDGRQYPRATGLFHLAILLPDRPALGQWLRHFVTVEGRMIEGAGDHLVSEALYLSDPEGNGLEIYRDRPREGWQFRGNEVVMDTLPVDLPALAGDARATPFAGMSPGTTLGHVHLRVRDVAETTAFYRDLLGFDYMTGMPGAGFYSVGGYHHHLGANIWHSRGAAPPPDGALGLIAYTIVIPDENSRQQLLARLRRAQYPVDVSGEHPLVRDPSGNGLWLTAA